MRNPAEKAGFRIPGSLVVLFVAVLLLRIAMLVWIGIPRMWGGLVSWELEWDSGQYIGMAADLADGVQDEASVRMPAYPALLNLVSTPGAPFTGALVANQVMGIAAAAILLVALREHSSAVATTVLLVSLFFLPYLHYSFKILPDVAAFMAGALSVLLFLRMEHERRPAVWIARNALLGLVVSLGMMIKPVIQFAVLPFIVVNLLFRAGRSFLLVLAGSAALLLSAYLLPSIWRHHNMTAFGLDALSTQDAFEPMGRFAILAGVTTQEEVWNGSYPDSIAGASMTGDGIDYRTRDSLYREETRRLLSGHFIRIVLPHFTTFPAYASPYEGRKLAGETYGSSNPLLLAFHGWITALFGVGCAAGWLLLLYSFLRRPPDRTSILLMLWTGLFILVFGPLRFLRYGLLFYWSLAAAAATGFERTISAVRERRWKRMGLPGSSSGLPAAQDGGGG